MEDVLYRVLSERPDVGLYVVGPVSVPSALASLPNVKTAAAVDYWRLPALMSICSKVIAPLEESAFNECKSRVKFLEAALSGCHLLASDIPDMAAIGEENLTLARSKDEWYEALTDFLCEEQRISLAKLNFDYIKQHIYVDDLMAVSDS
ncbi:glycosyltransferase [Martelella sp. FLE1502]